MEKTLQIDLNDIVSKQISKEIKILENDIKLLSKKNDILNDEIFTLKKDVKNSETLINLISPIRTEFNKIKEGEHDKGGWYDSKAKNQYLFIKNILKYLFNIEEEQNGWLSSRSDGLLHTYLAINYYNNKKTVINLLKILMENPNKEISFIENFKMPYDYPKEDVINFVTNPRCNTNGCIFNISKYWIEYDANKSNMPYSLIMKNPFILEEDVFNKLISSIKKKVPNYYYLFALPIYNTNISDEQIITLGECLLDIPCNIFTYEGIDKFISTNILKFNDKTLDYLYIKATEDNHYNLLHWQNFPTKYQQKYLMSKPLDQILNLLSHYSCKWSLEEKESFILSWTENKTK